MSIVSESPFSDVKDIMSLTLEISCIKSDVDIMKSVIDFFSSNGLTIKSRSSQSAWITFKQVSERVEDGVDLKSCNMLLDDIRRMTSIDSTTFSSLVFDSLLYVDAWRCYSCWSDFEKRNKTMFEKTPMSLTTKDIASLPISSLLAKSGLLRKEFHHFSVKPYDNDSVDSLLRSILQFHDHLAFIFDKSIVRRFADRSGTASGVILQEHIAKWKDLNPRICEDYHWWSSCFDKFKVKPKSVTFQLGFSSPLETVAGEFDDIYSKIELFELALGSNALVEYFHYLSEFSRNIISVIDDIVEAFGIPHKLREVFVQGTLNCLKSTTWIETLFTNSSWYVPLMHDSLEKACAAAVNSNSMVGNIDAVISAGAESIDSCLHTLPSYSEWSRRNLSRGLYYALTSPPSHIAMSLSSASGIISPADKEKENSIAQLLHKCHLKEVNGLSYMNSIESELRTFLQTEYSNTLLSGEKSQPSSLTPFTSFFDSIKLQPSAFPALSSLLAYDQSQSGHESQSYYPVRPLKRMGSLCSFSEVLSSVILQFRDSVISSARASSLDGLMSRVANREPLFSDTSKVFFEHVISFVKEALPKPHSRIMKLYDDLVPVLIPSRVATPVTGSRIADLSVPPMDVGRIRRFATAFREKKDEWALSATSDTVSASKGWKHPFVENMKSIRATAAEAVSKALMSYLQQLKFNISPVATDVEALTLLSSSPVASSVLDTVRLRLDSTIGTSSASLSFPPTLTFDTPISNAYKVYLSQFFRQPHFLQPLTSLVSESKKPFLLFEGASFVSTLMDSPSFHKEIASARGQLSKAKKEELYALLQQLNSELLKRHKYSGGRVTLHPAAGPSMKAQGLHKSVTVESDVSQSENTESESEVVVRSPAPLRKEEPIVQEVSKGRGGVRAKASGATAKVVSTTDRTATPRRKIDNQSVAEANMGQVSSVQETEGQKAEKTAKVKRLPKELRSLLKSQGLPIPDDIKPSPRKGKTSTESESNRTPGKDDSQKLDSLKNVKETTTSNERGKKRGRGRWPSSQPIEITDDSSEKGKVSETEVETEASTASRKNKRTNRVSVTPSESAAAVEEIIEVNRSKKNLAPGVHIIPASSSTSTMVKPNGENANEAFLSSIVGFFHSYKNSIDVAALFNRQLQNQKITNSDKMTGFNTGTTASNDSSTSVPNLSSVKNVSESSSDGNAASVASQVMQSPTSVGGPAASAISQLFLSAVSTQPASPQRTPQAGKMALNHIVADTPESALPSGNVRRIRDAAVSAQSDHRLMDLSTPITDSSTINNPIVFDAPSGISSPPPSSPAEIPSIYDISDATRVTSGSASAHTPSKSINSSDVLKVPSPPLNVTLDTFFQKKTSGQTSFDGSVSSSSVRLSSFAHKPSSNSSIVESTISADAAAQLAALDDIPPSVIVSGSTFAPSTNLDGSRIRTKWSDQEVKLLIFAVGKYGYGNWAQMKKEFGFGSRTPIDLKDKWRNLQKKM